MQVAFLLSVCLIISFSVLSGKVPVYAVGTTAGEVQKYSYSVRPALEPFNNIVYVTTDNPDPTTFRFKDKSSRYTGTADDDNESGVYTLFEQVFIDVKYEDESTYRVKGGYIFYNYNIDSDGGDLVLQYKDSKANWTDTSTVVKCPEMKDYVDYIIDTYTDDSDNFFDKMNAAQSGLSELSVYPNYVADNTTTNERSYPFLAASPYKDLTLNEHYDIYPRSNRKLFLGALYPYVLSSASFPGTMTSIAKRMNENATSEYDSYYHYLVKITLDGESKYYGGAGRGDNNPPYIAQIDHSFSFDGSDNDYSQINDLTVLADKYYAYSKIGDKNVEEMRNLIHGKAFCETISPGTWVRVAREGLLGYGSTFAYVAYGPGGSYDIASDAWVDGRYVNEYEVPELGATFEEHPNADIIVQNVSYLDINGKNHRNDIVYRYDSSSDTWRAPYYYNDAWWYSSGMTLPEQFILTRDQVIAMRVDENTKSIPESGRIYDGYSEPGTPFTNKIVKGLNIAESISMETGERKSIEFSLDPADATDDRINWVSADESIATVDEEGGVTAKKAGTTEITATTVDGGYIAKCNVTVVKPSKPAEEPDNSTPSNTKDESQQGTSETVNPSEDSGSNVSSNTEDGRQSTSQKELSARSSGDVLAADGTKVGKGASATVAEKEITSVTNDNDLPGSVFGKLQFRSTKQTKSSISLSWKKVTGATKYVIYGNKCGKTNKMKRLAVSTGGSKKFTKVLGKKLKKGTYHKFLVVALDENDKVVSSSKIIHVATKGGKVGNVRKVTTRAKNYKITVKKGKTFKLAGKQIAASKKLKVKKHRTINYESSNPKVASVSKKGIIKAKKKGTCYVYAYAQNGVYARVRVSVR